MPTIQTGTIRPLTKASALYWIVDTDVPALMEATFDNLGNASYSYLDQEQKLAEFTLKANFGTSGAGTGVGKSVISMKYDGGPASELLYQCIPY